MLRSIPLGLLLSTGLCMIAIASFAFASLDVSWVRDHSRSGHDLLLLRELDQILLRNVGAATVLYSGVVTFGFSSVIAASILSLYLGATMSLGIHSIGLAQLAADVVWYVPLEFGGLLLATTAGLQPVSGAIKLIALKGEKVTLHSVQGDLARSLSTFAVALVLIVAGAVIEGLLIQFRNT